MRQLLLLVLLVGFAVILPVTAQNLDANDCDIADAQNFYDAVDPEEKVSVQMLIAISSTNRASAKFAAIESIREVATTVEALEYPDCVEAAREWYLAGVDKIAVALEAFADGDFGTFASTYAEAVQRIGEFRGYLMALGVEVKTSETQAIFMR